MNHTVNLVAVAGLIVFDDTGLPIRIIRIPFVTLFFYLPAAVYLWLVGVLPAVCRLSSGLYCFLRRELAGWSMDLADIQLACRILALRWKYILLAYWDLHSAALQFC